MFLRIAFYFWDEQSFIGTYRIIKGKAALSAMREIIRAGAGLKGVCCTAVKLC